MKHSSKTKRQPTPVRLPTPPAGGSRLRWVLLGVGLLLATGATWAVMEFVVWNRLPSDLVGKWEVVQGPPEYQDAVFEFYRSGKMVGRLNDNGNLRIMNAEVRVDENKLFITTRHPRTSEEHVSVQSIRKISDRELVVADERGGVTKMVRLP
jgi:uncharacterized protein (TIGR03066 family)